MVDYHRKFPVMKQVGGFSPDKPNKNYVRIFLRVWAAQQIVYRHRHTFHTGEVQKLLQAT